MWWEGQEVVKGDGGAEEGMRERVFEVVGSTKQVRMAMKSLGSEIKVEGSIGTFSSRSHAGLRCTMAVGSERCWLRRGDDSICMMSV